MNWLGSPRRNYLHEKLQAMTFAGNLQPIFFEPITFVLTLFVLFLLLGNTYVKGTLEDF